MSTTQIDTAITKEVPKPVKALPAPKDATHHRSKWWVYAILALVVIGFGWFVIHLVQNAKAGADTDKKKAVHDLPVVSAKVWRGDMNQYLLGLGTVTPLSTVTLKSRVDGEIQQINFKEGDIVHKGDFLMQIDPRPYDAALKQAQGQLAKDTATKTSAEWAVKEDIAAGNGVSKQQLVNDTAARDSAIGAIEIDNANIESAQLNLTYAHITSPITGRIGLRLVDEGNIVHAADTTGLVVITQLQPITVVFTLPEDNLPQIQKRQAATTQPLSVDAYDRDLTRKIASGTVLAMDNEIDPTTGTVKIKAQFDNQDRALFPNQFVNARMLVNTIENAVLVPSAAIQHSPTGTFAYVVTPTPDDAKDTGPATKPADAKGGKGGDGIHGTVSVREVTTGATQASVGSEGTDTTVVLTGLEPGEIVVTDGVDKLIDGSKVVAHPAPPTAGSKRSTSGPMTMAGAATQPMAGHQHKRKNAE